MLSFPDPHNRSLLFFKASFLAASSYLPTHHKPRDWHSRYCLVSDSPPAWSAIDHVSHFFYYYSLAVITNFNRPETATMAFRAYTDALSKSYYEIWVSVLETHSTD